jgi:YfiH family protein
MITAPIFELRRHGFSTRAGGASRGVFAALNLGDKWGDEPGAIAENFRRFAEQARFALDKLRVVEQVHSRVVVTLSGTESIQDVRAMQADALVTHAPGLVLGVRTADCVPILLADREGRVAAVHAGWRGTVAGVVSAAIDAMVELGASPDHILAAIGPAICARCFEVGDEVVAQFAKVAPAAIMREMGKKPHIDLAAANHLQLLEGGVRPTNVWRSGRCTMHEPSDFFSYRRDGKTGQHLAFICS